MGIKIESGKIYEGLNLTGDGTGVGAVFEGVENACLRDCTISGFEDGITFGENCYGNSVERVRVIRNKRHALVMRPNNPGECNENYFTAFQALANGGDGVVVDGAKGNFFYGLHCEGNSGYGVNLGPTMLTTHNAFFGVWLEANKADLRFGPPWRVMQTKFFGGILQSSLPVSGVWFGYGNELAVEGGSLQVIAENAWWATRKLLGVKVGVDS